MARLYGNPTKFIRHIHDTGQIELDAQESLMVPFWYTDTSVSASADGTDTDHGENNDGIPLPLGSKVIKHKVTTTIEPSTIEPQNLYIGRCMLSFHDVMAPTICGQEFDSTGYRGVVTESSAGTPSVGAEVLQFYPDKDKLEAVSANVASTGKDIDIVKLEQLLAHWVNFKKVTLFDQRPLLGERWQRIPKKVKRLNPYTWYGMVFVNDSQTTGEVIQIQIQQYLEEMQIETPPTTIF